MTRSEYTQHADPAVIRRVGTRKVQFPEGVTLIRMIHGKFDGEDTLLACTSDGVYHVDSTTGVATKVEFAHRHTYSRRTTDRDYRPLLIALVAVLTGLALWATL